MYPGAFTLKPLDSFCPLPVACKCGWGLVPSSLPDDRLHASLSVSIVHIHAVTLTGHHMTWTFDGLPIVRELCFKMFVLSFT